MISRIFILWLALLLSPTLVMAEQQKTAVRKNIGAKETQPTKADVPIYTENEMHRMAVICFAVPTIIFGACAMIMHRDAKKMRQKLNAMHKKLKECQDEAISHHNDAANSHGEFLENAQETLAGLRKENLRLNELRKQNSRATHA